MPGGTKFRETKTCKHKHIWGIVLGLGGCQKIWGGGSFPMGEKQHINNILGKSRDNPVKFVNVFFSSFVFAPPPKCVHLHVIIVWFP